VVTLFSLASFTLVGYLALVLPPLSFI
jgi:hypothetical protein